MAKTIGVISIKGGVGKTTAVSNLGAIFSSVFNKKVLIVDANFTAPNLALHYGIVNPEVTLHDVLVDKKNIKHAVINHQSNLDILPSSLVGRKINPFKLKEKLKELESYYDVILIDSSPNLNEEMLATMIASDELLVVTSPDYPTLSATMHAVKVAKRKKVPITGLILNGVRGKSFELSLEDIEDATDVPVLAVLPDDTRILEALSKTIPAVMHAPMAEAVVEYKKLAASLIGEDYKDPRFINRLKRTFSRAIPKEEINRAVIRDERK